MTVVEKYAKHVNPSFVKLLGVFGYGRVFTRAKDVWLWDSEGRQYLDLLAGFGSVNLGHNHPRLAARLKAFFDEDAMGFCLVGPSQYAADLAEELSKRAPAPLEIALLTCGGGEAVEAAMKIARAATRRSGFVSCTGSFHGTSLGTLSIMGAERMRTHFEPLLARCVRVPFGDLPALEASLAKKDVAAFIVEPILGEGGVVLPPPGYLTEAKEICARAGTLFVLDEVQTGFGRTGEMFACTAEAVVPDVLVLAKGLSGGVVPVGAALVSSELHARAYGSMDRFDLHATTFGGNALSCLAGLETLRILDEEKLAANAAVRGAALKTGLEKALAGHPLVKTVRGRGLLIAIELGPTETGWMNKLAPSLVGLVSEKVFGHWASLKLLEAGIVCQPAGNNHEILKVVPPLTIGEKEVALAVDTIARVLGEYSGMTRLLSDVTQRLGSRAGKGFAWGQG